jgi:hypothetical protein
MASYRYIFLSLILACLAGCAHAPAAGGAGPAAVSQAGQVPREEFLRLAREPAAAKGGKDDFIEVDDRKGLLKTWPMALFVALIALACGVL